MRLKKAFLSSAVAVALAVALGAAAHADGKSNPSGMLARQSAVPADAAVARLVTPAVSPALSAASLTIKSRIVNFVHANGTQHTFGAYTDRASGKVIL